MVKNRITPAFCLVIVLFIQKLEAFIVSDFIFKSSFASVYNKKYLDFKIKNSA